MGNLIKMTLSKLIFGQLLVVGTLSKRDIAKIVENGPWTGNDWNRHGWNRETGELEDPMRAINVRNGVSLLMNRPQFEHLMQHEFVSHEEYKERYNGDWSYRAPNVQIVEWVL